MIARQLTLAVTIPNDDDDGGDDTDGDENDIGWINEEEKESGST